MYQHGQRLALSLRHATTAVTPLVPFSTMQTHLHRLYAVARCLYIVEAERALTRGLYTNTGSTKANMLDAPAVL